MPMLTSALLSSALASLPLIVEKVPCPELGTDVFAYIKMLTCAEAELVERIAGQNAERQLDALRATGKILPSADATEPPLAVYEAQAILDDPPTVRLPLVVATLCDEMGRPIITTDEHYRNLSNLPPTLIRRLHDVAWKLNSTGDAEVVAAVKNFARSRTSDSGTDWHANGGVLSESVSSLSLNESL